VSPRSLFDSPELCQPERPRLGVTRLGQRRDRSHFHKPKPQGQQRLCGTGILVESGGHSHWVGKVATPHHSCKGGRVGASLPRQQTHLKGPDADVMGSLCVQKTHQGTGGTGGFKVKLLEVVAVCGKGAGDGTGSDVGKTPLRKSRGEVRDTRDAMGWSSPTRTTEAQERKGLQAVAGAGRIVPTSIARIAKTPSAKGSRQTGAAIVAGQRGLRAPEVAANFQNSFAGKVIM
jgi:hypothetical protein